MKLKNIVLLLVVFLTIVLYAGSALAGSCCLGVYNYLSVPHYIGDGATGATCASQSLELISNCYDGTVAPLNTDGFETGYCCNTITNNPIDNSPDAGPDDTFKLYCDFLVEESGNFVYNGINDCGPSTSTESFYTVSGFVTDILSTEPLEGISVQYLDGGVPVIETTTVNGFYSMDNLPSGNVELRALSPVGHELSCIVSDQTVSVLGDLTDVDFSLSCVPNLASCTTDWFNGSWGLCVPYTVNGETIFVRFRDVYDMAECGTTIGQPTNIDTGSCEGAVSFGDCGNHVLDGYEQCDRPQFRDTVDFELGDVGSLACSSFPAFLPTEDIIDCTSMCTYDTSMCSPRCGLTCDRLSECTDCLELCEGNTDVCGDACEEAKPYFLNEFDHSSNNVFDLYESQHESGNVFSSVEYFEGTNDVEVSWHLNASCSDSILGFKVKVCKEGLVEDKCGDEEVIQFVPNLQSRSLRFVDVLDSNTVYCYNVAAVTLDGANENWAYNDTLPCFATGEDYCMDPHEPGLNCVSTNGEDARPVGCIKDSPESLRGKTNLSLLTDASCPAVGPTTICVETEYDPNHGFLGATCRTKSKCTLCNGLFGLYAAHDLKSFFHRGENDYVDYDCESFLFKGTSQSTPAEQIGLCYKDTAPNFGDVYDTCEKVSSCYDYQTRSACENDYCYKFSNDSMVGCEWGDYNNELGIGVCKPVMEEKEDCFKCDNSSPTGFCDENMCGLYGDCYFKESEAHDKETENYALNLDLQHTPLTSTCIHKNNMACYLYDNEFDCLGANGDSVGINVSYEYGFGTIGEREALYGNNVQYARSNDTYSFGDCFWDGDINSPYNGCNKNSDNYYHLWKYQYPSTTTETTYPVDDCEEVQFSFYTTTDKVRCFKDNETPETVVVLRDEIQQIQYSSEAGGYLPVYGKDELINITYVVNDSLSGSNEIVTYFSFTSVNNCSACVPFTDCPSCDDPGVQQDCYARNCELYPQHTLDEFDNLGHFLKEDVLHHGEMIMTYFSEDSSHNLEPVRFERLFIDALPPEFDQNFTYDVKSFLLDIEDVYASNLSIEFSLKEPSLCYGTLFLGPNAHPVGDFKYYGEEFSTFYPWLPDGYYDFELICYDDYQNKLEETYEITVEGDKSITNPRPRGGVFNHIEEVKLSIETPYDASCKLSNTRSPHSISLFNFLTTSILANSNTEHSIYYDDVQFDAPDISGTHVFFTSCDFGNGNITEMKNGDSISFTIDQEAPTTTVYASKTPNGNTFEIYDEASSEWMPTRSFQLSCDDTTTVTPVDNYGCQTIYYCVGYPADVSNFTASEDCMPDTNGQQYMKSFSGNEVQLDGLGYDLYQGGHLYFYSKDNGGKEEDLKRVNLRLRDTAWEAPRFKWLE